MKTSLISTQLLNDLMFLTSKETEGRLSGTKGARNAAKYIATNLSNFGVHPAGENGFFTYLDIYAARLNGPIKLSIGGKPLRHRIDFGEIPRFSNLNGNMVSGELIVIRDGDEMVTNQLSGKVVLIPETPKQFDLTGTVKGAEELGVKALLIDGGEPGWFAKSLNGSSANSIPVIQVRKKIALELEHQQGELVTISLPLISNYLSCQNVLGILRGEDMSKTLVLSAHYDHLGDDPEGFRFPGSIDNASGVSIILDLARRLSKQTIPFNILFAFFTGEESGLVGAKHFIKNTKFPINAAINVDSLGFEPALKRMRNGHKDSGNWLADLSADIIRKHNVEVAWIAGGEDSMAFQAEGMTAIGLGQKPTDPNQRGIHTPDDTMENLFLEPIEQGYEIMDELVQHLIDNPNLL
ncbi:M28 family metallopeptidase [Neobacillus sp. D3-1R]|uniref:M28 family metallopeptidase n=1 Tax=Neobacillus sp. D3-1R TaxID=3445778 RepID=UPI003FA1690F